MISDKKDDVVRIVSIIFCISAIIFYVSGEFLDLYYMYVEYEIPINHRISSIDILNIIAFITSSILLMLHTKLYNKRMAWILFTIAFVARTGMFIFVINFEYIRMDAEFRDVINILQCVVCIGVVITSFLKEKKFVKILLLCILCIAEVVLCAERIYFYRLHNGIMSIFVAYNIYFGRMLLGIAGIVNVVLIRRGEENVVLVDKMSSLEQGLIEIKRQYEAGIISEQEYNLKRADIIKNI